MRIEGVPPNRGFIVNEEEDGPGPVTAMGQGIESFKGGLSFDDIDLLGWLFFAVGAKGCTASASSSSLGSVGFGSNFRTE